MAFGKTKKAKMTAREEIEANQLRVSEPEPPESNKEHQATYEMDDATPEDERTPYNAFLHEKTHYQFIAVYSNEADCIMLPYSDLLTAQVTNGGETLTLTFSSAIIITCRGERLQGYINPLQRAIVSTLEGYNTAKHKDVRQNEPMISSVSITLPKKPDKGKTR